MSSSQADHPLPSAFLETTTPNAAREPLPASQVLGATPVFKEPLLQGGRLFWLEQLPAQRGRTSLFLQHQGCERFELTPELDLRSGLHGYGGGVFAVDADTAVVVAERGRSLWRLDLAQAIASGQPPQAHRITPPQSENGLYGDGLIDRQRDRWIGVLERDGVDQLVAVPLAGGEPTPLWISPDFCGYAVLSPCGTHLAWVSWQQPCLPWDRCQLWLGSFDPDGRLINPRHVSGSTPADPVGVSVFQPLWAGDALVVANDRSGWWNLEVLQGAVGLEASQPPCWRPLLPMHAEFAMPQWVAGMRTTAWDGHQLVAAACSEGRWQLGRLLPQVAGDGAMAAAPHALAGAMRWEPIALPFDDLAGLSAEAGRLVAIASGPEQSAGLLDLNVEEGGWSHHPADPRRWDPASLSRAEGLWFPGHGDRPTQAWYYPPQAWDGKPAPLLIRGHSGPTGMARTGLSLTIQFWTSRGWGVVDVNYGGSTGFGRAYRERLDGQWGVVDVDDCLAAAEALIDQGRADPAGIAMEGSSASGFTVLAAMARDDTIRAGAVRYPVTDLTALAESDHRFEERYFDTLVGPWPQARALYEQRSPLGQVDRLRGPLIVFHGLEDAVVPPDQSRILVERLRQRGVPVDLLLFEAEGHGFRDGTVQRQVLEATEAFFRRHLGLEAQPLAEGQ
ncbi:MAG: prolyl oligopeptidase family serine peptidase [Synechococcus sp. ELA057]